jgi:hypothetical protein
MLVVPVFGKTGTYVLFGIITIGVSYFGIKYGKGHR